MNKTTQDEIKQAMEDLKKDVEENEYTEFEEIKDEEE